MNIEAQFNLIAEEYDCNRRKFIPCFDDYYKNLTQFIISSIKKPKKVLDLGAGTGLLSYYWYVQCSSAEYVLVDIADEMLDVSRKRFSGLNNVQHRIMDYTKALPKTRFVKVPFCKNYKLFNKICMRDTGGALDALCKYRKRRQEHLFLPPRFLLPLLISG